MTIHDTAYSLGYCCTFMFIRETMKIPVRDLASLTGISTSSLWRWRRDFALGRLACANHLRCARGKERADPAKLGLEPPSSG